MNDAPMPTKPRPLTLAVLLNVLGWTALAASSHNKVFGVLTATVLGAAWTAAVSLSSGIWGRAERTLVELAGEWIDVVIRDFFSAYRKRYLSHIRSRFGTFDAKGLVTQGPFSLEIEQVYVELSVGPKQAATISGHPLQKSHLDIGRHDLWSFLSPRQVGFQNFAILGAPGSGKTTLLKHLAVCLAAHHGHYRGVKRIPVLFFTRDHAEEIAANPDKSIIDLAEVNAKKMTIPAPEGWFQREFRKGHCAVMLDGLDEIADSNLRKTVAEWVDRQMEAYDTNNQFLITSRPFGYRSNPLSRVTVLEVCPFTLEQTKQFIRQWYLANEAMSARKDTRDEGVQIRAREGAADLLNRLRATPDLAELAVNPLLLTMIANVHRYRSSLPGRRVELYAEICEVFLGKRQQARGLDLELTPAQIKSVLQPLALAMMNTQLREIPCADAVEIIAGPLSLISGRLGGEEFLAMVQNRSGLLVERESGTWGFAHLTFQEYLAANAIIDGRRERELECKVADAWWHETIRLYSAQTDATRIVEACISGVRPTVPQLTLAVECLEEARQVQPYLREEVAALMEAGLEDSSPERARLAAETKLVLRLRRLARIDNDRYIDSQRISCAEYQLFIDARRAANDYRQPDHWPKMHFAAGTAKEPVLGVRPSDAEAFCEWLSERFGGEWYYRIPDKGNEIDNTEVESYWVSTPNGIQLYGEPCIHPELTPKILLSRLFSDCDEYGLRDSKRMIERLLARDWDLVRELVRDHVGLRYLDFDGDHDFGNAIFNSMEVFCDVKILGTFTPDFVRVFDFDVAQTYKLARARNLRLARISERDLRRTITCAIARRGTRERIRARAVSRILSLLIARSVAKDEEISGSKRISSLLGIRRVWSTNQGTAGKFLELYAALVLLEERIEGRFPASEGIRIVKVRKALQEQTVAS